MLRKRTLRGVVALVLALGLFVATGAQAAEGPQRGLTGLWTSVELWFHDLMADWLGTEPTATTSASETEDSPTTFALPESPTGPWTQDGGSGDESTTDGGPVSDPDG